MDSFGTFLRYLAGIDLPREILLVCHHGSPPALRRGQLALIWTGECLSEVPNHVEAQLYACGVPAVTRLHCPMHGAIQTIEAAAIVAGARSEIPANPIADANADGADTPAGRLVPSVHGERETINKTWFNRRKPGARAGGQIVYLGQIQLSRRTILGFNDRLPIDGNSPRQVRIRNAIKILDAKGVDTSKYTSAPSDTLRLRVDEKCWACGTCTRTVPGALTLDNGEFAAENPNNKAAADGKVLTQHLATDGDLAAAIRYCPAGALYSDGYYPLSDVIAGISIELAHIPIARCGRCHAEHRANSGQLCPVCREISSNPFISRRLGAASGSSLIPPEEAETSFT